MSTQIRDLPWKDVTEVAYSIDCANFVHRVEHDLPRLVVADLSAKMAEQVMARFGEELLAALDPAALAHQVTAQLAAQIVTDYLKRPR